MNTLVGLMMFSPDFSPPSHSVTVLKVKLIGTYFSG